MERSSGQARLQIATLALIGGCGFSVNTTPSDAPMDMIIIDTDTPPPTVFASCKALRDAMPTTASGTYTIDPDGTGPDASLSVTCDMTTDGGGWTIVFLAASSNLMNAPMTYTSATPPLLQAAQTALVAYRDDALLAAPNFARFDLPAAWKTATPFSVSAVDLVTPVSINGAAAANATLRYGDTSFQSTCGDPWMSSLGKWGRICIAGTQAPFYTGFAAMPIDTCTNSMANWDTSACSTTVRFSIAVR